MWSDYIILVADDVPESIFNEVIKNDKKKFIHWKIRDVEGKDVGKREKTMLQLQEKIKEFLEKHKNNL